MADPRAPVHYKLFPECYEAFFRRKMSEDRRALEEDMGANAIYDRDVAITRGPANGEQRDAICSVVVPGLIEKRPSVGEDGVVELRQLPSPSHASSEQDVSPTWTRIIYLDRVASIVRSTETLHLCVYSLALLVNEVRFNIQFKGAKGKQRTQYQVLAQAQHALRQKSWLKSILFPIFNDYNIQA